MAQKKHGVVQEKALSELVAEHTTKLKDARSDLRELRKEDDYDTESSEAIEAKEMVALYKTKKAAAIDSLKNYSPSSEDTKAINQHSSLLLAQRADYLSKRGSKTTAPKVVNHSRKRRKALLQRHVPSSKPVTAGAPPTAAPKVPDHEDDNDYMYMSSSSSSSD